MHVVFVEPRRYYTPYLQGSEALVHNGLMRIKTQVYYVEY